MAGQEASFPAFSMKLLEALNRVLRGSGKGALQEVGDESMDKGDAQEALNRSRIAILTNGYAFNTDTSDLQPDPNEGNKVPYPEEMLYVGIGSNQSRLNRANTDTRLLSYRYTDNSTGDQQAFLFDLRLRAFVKDTVKNIVTVFDVFDAGDETDQGFNRIPQLCADWIAKQAAAEFFHEVNASPSATLAAAATRASTKFVNRERFSTIHGVTGFAAIEAIGSGGSTTSLDVRTQARLL